MRRYLFLMVFAVLPCGCAHEGLSLGAEEYYATVARNTLKSNQYTGLYQTFQADMTILNSEMQTATLRQRASFLQWNDTTYRGEREKSQQDASAYAKFFLRFYCPDHDYDDLHKPKSIWKVYLDYSGQRFEGKVKKMTDKYVEIQTLFPHFDRFSTPYEVTFSVPMARVENGPSKVVLTSSLGTAEFNFAGKK